MTSQLPRARTRGCNAESSVSRPHVDVFLLDAKTITDAMVTSRDSLGGGAVETSALNRDVTPHHQHTKARWGTSRLNRQLALRWSTDGKIYRTAEGRPFLDPLVAVVQQAHLEDKRPMACRAVVMCDFNSSHSGSLGAVAVLSRSMTVPTASFGDNAPPDAGNTSHVLLDAKDALTCPQVLLGLDVELVPSFSTDDSSEKDDSFIEYIRLHLRRLSVGSFTSRELDDMFASLNETNDHHDENVAADAKAAPPIRRPLGGPAPHEDGLYFDAKFSECMAAAFLVAGVGDAEDKKMMRRRRRVALGRLMLKRWHQQWTFKEAILKALGVGIPFGVRRIEVLIASREKRQESGGGGGAWLETIIDGVPVGQWLHLEPLGSMEWLQSAADANITNVDANGKSPNHTMMIDDGESEFFVGSIALFAVTAESQTWFASSLRGRVVGKRLESLPGRDRRPFVAIHRLAVQELLTGSWVQSYITSSHLTDDDDDDAPRVECGEKKETMIFERNTATKAIGPPSSEPCWEEEVEGW